MGTARDPEVPAGLGGYELVRRIAVGGMAELMLARQTVRPDIERLVVIKSILPGLSEHTDLVTLFLSEARIAAQLQHPNVVQIHDVTTLGARPCIVMEHLVGLDGRGLFKRAQERGEPIPIGLIAAIGEGAALGLGYAHRAIGVDGQLLSVVHRDVSPHNLFVTVDGAVKLLDFGIAKSSAQLEATRQGTLRGKLAYMSPEQLRGEALDGRSDLFALGAVLWELATGQALFGRATEVETFSAVLEREVPPPGVLRAGVPEAFDRVVLGVLSRDRNQRPPTGEALASALHAIAEAACDGPPGQALARYVRTLVEDPDRRSSAPPASGTMPGTGLEPTEQRGAPSLESAAVPAPAFAIGALSLEGIDEPARIEARESRPSARPSEPAQAEPAEARPSEPVRRSAYPERATPVPPDVRDRFDPDGEVMAAARSSGPGLALAVDLDVEHRAMGRAIVDRDRRAAAVAAFGTPPFVLLTPLYMINVLRRRAVLARRARALKAEVPTLEAEARATQAAIGRAVREATKDHRLASEMGAVERAQERVAAAAAAGSLESPRDAELHLEEKLAHLGQAAVTRVAAPAVTGPLEAEAMAATRRLEDARTELELCLHGRQMYDPAAFRSGWILVFLAVAATATLIIAPSIAAGG